MSFMFEAYYKVPVDLAKEEELATVVAGLGGSLEYREMPDGLTSDSICLTYEFEQEEAAEAAAATLRGRGDYVEGPVSYGD